MNDTIMGIIIGGVLTQIGNIVPQLILTINENNKKNQELKHENNVYWRENKLKSYSQGLEVVLAMRKYFDISKDDYIRAPDAFKNEVKEMNLRSLKASVDIRLYGTDEIANIYYDLSKYSRFAISNDRLFEESKEAYVIYCNLLAKKMREDIKGI